MKTKKLDQEIIRINKLDKLKKLGINPYPSETYKITHTTKEILQQYKLNTNVSIAGRVTRINIIGKSCFIAIQDHVSKIQAYCKKNETNDIIFDKLIDIGDIIGIEGYLFKTKVQEITIYINKIKLLSKAIKPIPVTKIDKIGNIYDKFKNTESRFRKRYLDLIVNHEIKNVFIQRSKIISYIRYCLDQKNYIEVETPILQPLAGGATAKPFITYHNTLNRKLYLRIANELYLKRLIIGGFKGVYELSKNFRNEGMDKNHNPEFTMLELYVSYKDYLWMMIFIEKLIKKIYNNIIKDKILINENNIKIDFKKKFRKITLIDSIKEHTNYDITNMNINQLIEISQKMKLEIKSENKNKIIDNIFTQKCEKKYIQPTFIIDHPIETCPLSKKHRKNERLIERFELIINGQEICNAYSELNDPIEQLHRFKKQINKTKNNKTKIDEDFIEGLKYGMPPTAGIGIGIDRLIMIMTNQKSIQEVILFPQMKT